MTLQVRLTLWSLLIMASIVTIISALDLTDEINRQFDIRLRRSVSTWKLASSAVNRSLLRYRYASVPVQDRVRDDPGLTKEFQELLSEGGSVVAIAVSGRNDEILNDADPAQIGRAFSKMDDFQSLVARHWWNKLRALTTDKRVYQYSG
ncbi:MAG: hypothetical protein M3Z09_02340, partial [Acidobacteriota bacterium]|nr:hypothetical protein [Acidobacteriota bacterium]